jgi:WD40 repeat protein
MIEESSQKMMKILDSENYSEQKYEETENLTTVEITNKQESQITENLEWEEMSHFQSLNLKWCLGYDCTSLNNVHNLTNDSQSKLVYSSGNNGIIFDYKNKKQKVLQGHTDKISNIQFNETKNVIATADQGESCMIIIWDADTSLPLKTFFEPHQNGVAVISFSQCGQ